MLVRWLRPHQREGVAFMFECVTGQRVQGGNGEVLATLDVIACLAPSDLHLQMTVYIIAGCILADDMVRHCGKEVHRPCRAIL